MADDVSGVLVTHRPKQKSARCVGWDGDEVLEGLYERKRGEKEREEKTIKKSQDKSREVAKERESGGEDNDRLTSGTMVKVALRSAAISIAIASKEVKGDWARKGVSGANEELEH